jgi:hypothetical protein
MNTRRTPATKKDTSKHDLQNSVAIISLYIELLVSSLEEKDIDAALGHTALVQKHIKDLSKKIGYD